MTSPPTNQLIRPTSTLLDMRDAVFDRAEFPNRPFRKQFRDIRQIAFDDFLYEFDLGEMGLPIGSGVVAVMVLKPDLQALYGCDPTYFGTFDRASYADYIEQRLGPTIADKLALVADELIWFSPDLSWAAFGSRDLELVVVGRR